MPPAPARVRGGEVIITMQRIPTSAANRRINRKPTRAELEAKRQRDRERLEAAWDALTVEAQT